MQNQPRRFPVGIAVTVATLIAAGSATAYFTQRHAQNSNPTPPIAQSQPNPAAQTVPPAPPQNPTEAPSQPASPTVEKTAQIYGLRDRATDLELAPVLIKVKSEDRPEAQLTAAMNALLNGTFDKSITSAIPEGTQLRSLKVKPDGIYVDLSKSFVSGGGSATMQGRLAQVIYTATSLNPTAPVYLFVEGKPITSLGGEGLEVSQPMTRSQLEQGEGMKGE